MRRTTNLLFIFLCLSAQLQAQWCATPSSSSSPIEIRHSKSFQDKIRIPVVFYIIDDNPNPKIQLDYSPADLQFQLDWLNQQFAEVQMHNPNQQIQFCIARANQHQALPLPSMPDIDYVEQLTEPKAQGGKGIGVFYVNRDAVHSLPFNDAYIHSMTGLDHSKFLVIVMVKAGQQGTFASYSTDIHGWSQVSSPFQHIVLLHQHLHTQPGSLNDGDVLVHEVGHYLGLAHVFQNSCQQPGDRIADTPPYSTSHLSDSCEFKSTDACPSYAASYPALRSNHMDYKGDVCRQSFTAGQTARMVAVCNKELGAMIADQNVQDAELRCNMDMADYPLQVVYHPAAFKRSVSAPAYKYFQVYPNPAKDFVQIDIPEKYWESEIQISIQDYSLRIIEELSLDLGTSSIIVPVQHLEPGNYILSIRSEGFVQQQLILIK